jgi:Flp pilus assembly pilin Flp
MPRQRSGQALVEYVVLLALASVVAVATITVAGPQLSQLFGQVSAAIADPMALLAPTPTPSAMPAAAAPSTPDPGPSPAAPTADGHDQQGHRGQHHGE